MSEEERGRRSHRPLDYDRSLNMGPSRRVWVFVYGLLAVIAVGLAIWALSK